MLKLLYTRVTGAGLDKFYVGTTIFLNTQDSVLYKIMVENSLEIGWTDPARLHDAKSEWRGRVTITGYC